MQKNTQNIFEGLTPAAGESIEGLDTFLEKNRTLGITPFVTSQLGIHSDKKNLPTLEEFKRRAKQKKEIGKFEKLGHAQNALAQEYGYKEYRAIKPLLQSEKDLGLYEILEKNGSIPITAEDFKEMQRRDVFRSSQYTSSNRFQEKHYFKNQENIIQGIAINPCLPDDFDNIAHNDRDGAEVKDWWERAYIQTDSWRDESYSEYISRLKEDGYSGEIETQEVYIRQQDERKESWYLKFPEGIRYTVRMLDGGAWDRSTYHGNFNNLKKACDKALLLNKGRDEVVIAGSKKDSKGNFNYEEQLKKEGRVITLDKYDEELINLAFHNKMQIIIKKLSEEDIYKTVEHLRKLAKKDLKGLPYIIMDEAYKVFAPTMDTKGTKINKSNNNYRDLEYKHHKNKFRR